MVAGSPLESVAVRDQVMPRLRRAGWSEDCWKQEYQITDGRRTVVDGRVRRGMPLRADLVLLHDGHPIAVVEAKHSMRSERDGVQQARDYARRLDLPLAYATNGAKIIEIDLRNQTEHEVERFRSPGEMWDFYQGAQGLESEQALDFFATPYSASVRDSRGRPKLPRYYQHVALQRLLTRIADGDRRLLVVLATGTGKTSLAAQLVHVLWRNHWPRGAAHREDRPRVLYLADRDSLITQPQRDWFRPIFGDRPMTRIRGSANDSKHLYFALYQALDTGGDDRDELFREYDRDFFDLVIVDECHRGSASASSSWRDVLNYFEPAVQLGMTATPVYRDQADTYGYFGNPVYTYSLRDGIEDGFLAPFEVIRARLDRDIDGVEIPEGMTDREDQLVPEGTYGPTQFERKLVLPERTEEVARYLTAFLRRTGETGKTIIFCQDQDHAARMREALVNLNSDLLQRHGDRWVVRITSNERDRVQSLDDFQREESPLPVVAVTSQLLSTGVDIPTTRTIVLFRRIESIVEFKQIIGRGTRLAPDYDKEYFTIIDFVGATRKFDDPQFDGPAVRVIEPGADDDLPVPEPLATEPDGEPDDEVAEPVAEYEEQDSGELNEPHEPADDDEIIRNPDSIDAVTRRSEKYVVDGYDFHVTSEQLYIMDPQDGVLRRVRLQQWVRDRVKAMGREPDALLEEWATARGRRELRELLGETLYFDVDELAGRLHRPDCDPIDLLISLAWDWPLLSRSERVSRFRARERENLDSLSPRARQILGTILDKYEAHGVEDLSPRVLQTAPLSELGSPLELAEEFGGPAGLHETLDDLGRRLFEAS